MTSPDPMEWELHRIRSATRNRREVAGPALAGTTDHDTDLLLGVIDELEVCRDAWRDAFVALRSDERLMAAMRAQGLRPIVDVDTPLLQGGDA